jgi:hypothetical protein
MTNWLEDNLYSLLEISPNATKKEIQAAYDKARRATKETRRQRELSDARDQLTRVEKRLAIDAFVLDVAENINEMELEKEITPLTTTHPDWLSFLDVPAVIAHDTEQLTNLIITLSIPITTQELKPIDHYDGLQAFEKDLGL